MKNLQRCIGKLEHGDDEKPAEIIPGLWMTGSEVGKMLRTVAAMPRRLLPQERDGRNLEDYVSQPDLSVATAPLAVPRLWVSSKFPA
jgi:hypothetical protein